MPAPGIPATTTTADELGGRSIAPPWVARREVHLVVVDATPAQARAGQRARGRIVRERAMRRHERGWADARVEREQWTTVTRLTRSAERSEAVADAAHRLQRPGAVAELAAQ
ncbi:hypothetical protein VSS74_22410 [Conexibacter stalactiti]|uniref:Uncharacterized protein n=1 Tax=Conexibacter stalactiti TaxID=1940611 RepID=A0ABU4HV08_9ACTN|nr:hypothetical protein [Conexibacter stalactiti]MDW5597116.1 hypothetical protein [Conexibacter stalactiti]MEC5037758.1 hypothetical protein [Conexibacter stalactiti]